MNIRICHTACVVVAIAILATLEACGSEIKEVKELTITEIQPGPRYNWPGGGSSGAGRWVVKDGKFGTSEYGAAYFEADRMPAIFFGAPGNLDETLQWSRGTTHVVIGKNKLKGFIFDSDPKYPLTFKLVEEKGYTYLSGRGTVTDKSGKVRRLGYGDTVEMWLPLIESSDFARAAAAAQALGYLAKTAEDKNKVVPLLITAAKSPQFEVCWNATEALGRLADSRALPALEDVKATRGGFLPRVAEESIRRIKGDSK